VETLSQNHSYGCVHNGIFFVLISWTLVVQLLGLRSLAWMNLDKPSHGLDKNYQYLSSVVLPNSLSCNDFFFPTKML